MPEAAEEINSALQLRGRNNTNNENNNNDENSSTRETTIVTTAARLEVDKMPICRPLEKIPIRIPLPPFSPLSSLPLLSLHPLILN